MLKRIGVFTNVSSVNGKKGGWWVDFMFVSISHVYGKAKTSSVVGATNSQGHGRMLIVKVKVNGR